MVESGLSARIITKSETWTFPPFCFGSSCKFFSLTSPSHLYSVSARREKKMAPYGPFVPLLCRNSRCVVKAPSLPLLTRHSYKSVQVKTCALPRMQAGGQLKEIRRKKKCCSFFIRMHMAERNNPREADFSAFTCLQLSKPSHCLDVPACVSVARGRH